MEKFIFTIAIEVVADNQELATYIAYNTQLRKLNTNCLDIDYEEND